MNVFKLMYSYGLKNYRQTDRQTDIHKLLVYVQGQIEWYIIHECCSKKHGHHKKQYISQKHSDSHNYYQERDYFMQDAHNLN